MRLVRIVDIAGPPCRSDSEVDVPHAARLRPPQPGPSMVTPMRVRATADGASGVDCTAV
jgi:hypothetical protein